MVDELKIKKLARDFAMVASKKFKNGEAGFYLTPPTREESEVIVKQFGMLEKSKIFHCYGGTKTEYDKVMGQNAPKILFWDHDRSFLHPYGKVDFLAIANTFSRIAERIGKSDELKELLPKDAKTLTNAERRYIEKDLNAPNFEKLCSPAIH